MKRIIVAMLALAVLPASAECWVVSNLKGSTFMKDDGYKRIDDGFSGSFMITIDEKNSSVVTNGADAGGMKYIPTSKNTIVGLSQSDSGEAVETWSINNDRKVLMTKVITGWGGFDSSKAFVGDVVGKC
ncbi:TPA: hypothetical protein ACSTLY_002273 [Serratia fonticola]|uniref:Uncharacterized protein n=1 Tax=Serratia fonticola TaxID=47917 RepID=A0A3S5AVF8_SERFO|nr:hypothetical protein [Serratia fonticola]CAI1109167.1 Uncharacterised protein [Serratia fonticola]VEI71353.1 Uncharacterised protein [Serratia fonticola]